MSERAHNAITARYLEAAASGRLPTDVLAKTVEAADISRTHYRGAWLYRPGFLSRAEQAQVTDDLALVYAALMDLPARLFGGDLAAFARAVGATEPQVQAVLRSHTDWVPRLARGDLYRGRTGFQLLELNITAALGGLDSAALNDALLGHPEFAAFAVENRLGHVDTMVEVGEMLRAECDRTGRRGTGGERAGGRPVVAIVDEYQSFLHLQPVLHPRAARFAEFGMDVLVGHLAELSYRDGRVWLAGRSVDVVYRLFQLDQVADPGVAELIDPLLGAAERGEVRIFTPIGVELYGSKAALALLSDEANRASYGAEELAAFDRILPWTRMVRPGPVTVDGRRVDLVEYAREHREDLVLKATLRRSGAGFVAGWLVGADEWDQLLTEAMHGPYVLQRRIRPVPEPFPAPDGPTRPWIFNWGIFLSENGYAGGYIRGSEDTAVGVIAYVTGAPASCVFHETAEQGG